MIVKVKEPLPQEYQFLRPGLLLFGYLHLAADRALTTALLEREVSAVAYETITDSHGQLPCLVPMSAIAGRLAVQLGARCLEAPAGGPGVLLGGVPGVARGRVVILGGGTVGTQAAIMAAGLGADVTIFDVSLRRLYALDQLFAGRVQTLHVDEFALVEHLRQADMVIGAVLIPGASAPKLLRRDHLSEMQNGAVLVDVAVDQGGCAESTRPTSYDEPTFVEEGVIHYCVANMPAAVAKTSTAALTAVTRPYGRQLAGMGLEQALHNVPGLSGGVNTHRGQVVHPVVAQWFAGQ